MDIYAICFAELKTKKRLYLGVAFDALCVTKQPEEAGPLFPTMTEAAKYLKKNNKKIDAIFEKESGDMLGIVTIKNIKDIMEAKV